LSEQRIPNRWLDKSDNRWFPNAEESAERLLEPWIQAFSIVRQVVDGADSSGSIQAVPAYKCSPRMLEWIGLGLSTITVVVGLRFSVTAFQRFGSISSGRTSMLVSVAACQVQNHKTIGRKYKVAGFNGEKHAP